MIPSSVIFSTLSLHLLLSNQPLHQFSASTEMENPSANKNMPPPPPGYPTEQTMQPGAKAVRPQTKARGEKGFIEGCLAALCCCWICETCCV